MKAIYTILLSFAALSLLFFGSACERPPCKKVDCGAHGVCIEGTCECENGYEGTFCETAVNMKFEGIFSFSHYCSDDTSAYEIDIVPSASDPTLITITGLWNQPAAGISAVVSELNGFTLINGTDYVPGFDIEGFGSITSSISPAAVTINFWISDSVNTDACSGYGIRP